MGETTGISWTDHTFNPWWGCTRVSLGCVNCYAETFDKRIGGDHWGPGKPRRTFGDHHWNEPIRWDRKARKDGVIRKVFCASMADIFDIEAPVGERDRLWKLIDNTPNLIWQLLTKRVEGYGDLMRSDLLDNPRVWKGFTAENQPNYDERWHQMKRWPGITWCSYEPAIGPLTMLKVWHKPNWIVFGGESGHGRRPCEQSWAEDLLRECRAARNVAFFMKQMSARTPDEGKALIPTHLMVHEFPEGIR